MLTERALNYLGGMPDRLFVRAAGLLRKSCREERAAYLRALRFYEKFSGPGPSPELFDLPCRAPELETLSETPCEGGAKLAYRFKSLYRVKNPAVREEFASARRNAFAFLHLWRHPGRARRPLVLCLHGFLLGDLRLAQRMFRVRKLFAQGVDVGLFVLPHHGERTDFFLNQKLLNPQNVPLSVEGCAQTQHDLNASLLALRRLGYGRIGLIGASLGGFSAIVQCALSDIPEFLFAVVPATDLHDYLMPDARLFPFPVDAEVREATSRALDLVTPRLWRPRIDPGAIAAVLHAGDRLNPIGSARTWAKAWRVGRVTEIPGGHWLHFDGKARGRSWYRWLAEKKFTVPEKSAREGK